MTDDLVRQLLATADHLDAHNYPYSGVVRRAARALAPGPRCQQCGEPVHTRAAEGRPPRYCSGACRLRSQRGDSASTS